MNIAIKALILTLITSFTSSMLQAMNTEKRFITIQFYQKATENTQSHIPELMGSLAFFDMPEKNSAYVCNFLIQEKYSGHGLMKIFMAYMITYIYRTSPMIDTIHLESENFAHKKLSQNILDSAYLKCGYKKDTNLKGNDFVYDLNQIKNSFLDFSKIPLEKNSQIFKNMYVKIIDQNTHKQINVEKDQNNSGQKYTFRPKIKIKPIVVPNDSDDNSLSEEQSSNFDQKHTVKPLFFMDENGMNFMPIKSKL